MAEYRVTLTFSSSDPLHRENLALCLVLLIATLGLFSDFMTSEMSRFGSTKL